MSAIFATSALFLIFFAFLTVPLIPACRELIRKTDQAPLNVVQQYAGDIRFFADGFRHYLASIQPNLESSESRGSDAIIATPDGVPCIVLAPDAPSHDLGIDHGTCARTIVSLGDLTLPAATTFVRDIYARRNLEGGANNQYRAVLGESHVHLAEDSIVMRWVHAVGELECAPRCCLYGRVSSDRSILLRLGCNFTRLNAPRIAIGAHRDDGSAAASEDTITAAANEIVDRILHEGDFRIAHDQVFAKHLVVRGELHVGAGARILGNVKAQKAVLEPGVIVQGSLISSMALRIGPNCRLHGPVIAERAIFIGEGTQVGSAETPTTVSAPKIEIAENAVVFGTMWAREHGHVVELS